MKRANLSLKNQKYSESENYLPHKKKVFAPPLNDEFYAQSYELRKAASTMTVAAIEWFHRHVTELLKQHDLSSSQDNTFSVLSIGSGEGDVDLEIIRSLFPRLKPQWKQLQYVALEPNPIHRDRFLKRLDKERFDQSVEVSVRDEFFEPGRFESQQKYDLVLLTHVLYYFDNPYQAIRTALKQTKKGGRVVIIHQTAMGIPQIQREYMLEAKGNKNEMFVAEDIKDLLDTQSHQYQFYNVDARLDVTECLQCSETGVKIMSFCMECDLRQLQDSKFANILRAFKRLAQVEDRGQAFIREPIGVFVLQQDSNIIISKRSPEDKETVVDYWQLASNFDWPETFLSQYHQGQASSLRLIDIACGTGRWLQTFCHYIQLDENIENVVYDSLDPCYSSISQASQKSHSPFVRGTQYIDTIQSANLERNAYDLLWSMHGFYVIPPQDLPGVLKKCTSLLKDTGIGFIALATRESFYIDFYERYLQIFKQGEAKGFTSAEDILEAFLECGIQHRVHKITYEEAIKTDNLASLEHYIKNEATINSFNKDVETKLLSTSKNINLEDLLSNPEMEKYLKSFIRNSVYYFPQEVWLISFHR